MPVYEKGTLIGFCPKQNYLFFYLYSVYNIKSVSNPMSQTTLLVQNVPHFDAVSEASTDGYDYQCSVLNPKVGSKKNVQKNKAKSSLCKNFSEKGYCPYGFKCQFAHGLEELRCNVDENSYKTKPCNSFWRKGHCPYGFRCNFSHSRYQDANTVPTSEKVKKSL